MPEKKKTAGWRKFEELLQRIEATHAPKGATITSPDHIRDLTTGKLREVDASVRYKVGSVEILIAFECRKRGQKGDVTWIEQLAQKRLNLGISSIVAVSAKGFTKEAQEKARQLGIKTRILNNIENFNIESALSLEIVSNNTTFSKVIIEFHEPVTLEHSEIFNSKVFQMNGQDLLVDQRELLMEILESAIQSGEVPDYRAAQREGVARFGLIFDIYKVGYIRLLQNGNWVNLKRVAAQVTATVERPPVSAGRKYRYHAVDERETKTYWEFDVGDPSNPNLKFLYCPESENSVSIFKGHT